MKNITNMHIEFIKNKVGVGKHQLLLFFNTEILDI